MVAIDVPMLSPTMSGQFSMCGWAYDYSVVSSVQVTDERAALDRLAPKLCGDHVRFRWSGPDPSSTVPRADCAALGYGARMQGRAVAVMTICAGVAMRPITRTLAVLAGLASGCAAIPEYKNSTAPDAACVKGNFASLGDWFSKGEAHIRIKEIDGTPTDQRKPFCFAPGRHELGVYAINSHQEAQDYLNLDFAPSKNYWLHGNLRGISFVIQFDDITAQPPTNVSEFRLKASSTGQPVAVPVYIPAK